MSDLRFGDPASLTLLVLPAALLLLWASRFVKRRSSLRVLVRRRVLPVSERFRPGGELTFWLCQILTLALMTLALARPQAPSSVPRRAGLDVVVLQDASASMRVADISRQALAGGGGGAVRADQAAPPPADRWQRSMRFLRALGDALSWQEDRVALTVFAHLAAPQIRLTRDPNTLFFFLDHLYERPPFRLEDDATWDTNLELGIAWGLRVIDKDEEIHGRSPNAKVFVLVSDGETWSGEVAKAVDAASRRGVPLNVVGVGSLRGGPLPDVPGEDNDSERPGISRLERAALQRIAAGGHGQYFEIDRETDAHIANTIIASGRRLAPSIGMQQSADELYWWFLCGAAAMAGVGVLFLRQRAELVLALTAGLIAAALAGPMLW
jgi:Ca-activated chloride channel family protein